ncbi:G5 domain-containing protein [Streptococcus xiaochunlingii]|uniref:G5 domain-containing protein n=1 Tax=Streptococcus TaxID=1301 RepID=UPI00189CD438|nr:MULTISPECIES: G5 domain-containing protein [Streptococcus]MDK8387379.1 G5 domain-containing protein [Streptococcus xiaochunlingii]MDK8777922.1 G5 domain-containing protein [Streptococcus xiaochunlingii]
MNIKKTTKYSLLAIGVLTTFQLGQVKASADSFENSNESLIKNQGENQPALNETVSIPEAETRVVTEPNPEEKPAVDQGDKKYPAPALTEKETKSSEEDAKNPSTEASSSDKDSKAETTLNKDSEAEASLSKDSKTDPTLNSVEKKEDPTLAPGTLSNASTNEAETDATPAPKIRRKRAAASNTKVYEDADYGKYVKATDFGLDTTGKVEASEAIKKALSAANEVEGGASVMLSGTVLLKNTLVIDENYANVKGLIGSGPSRNNTKILFNKKQDGEHDPETNLTDNRYESAVLIQNQNNFTVGRLTVEHAYDSSDYTKDNEFYRKGKSYFGRSNGIYVNDSSNVTINDVRAMKFNRAGVFFSSSKATAQEYDSNGRPIRYSSISEKVSNEVKSIGDPDVPIMDGNKVTNSFLHNNRVAGVMFGYQRNFVVDNNILSYNGHVLDGGTGYGAASMAGSYNDGITYTGNYTNYNYRKGLDIHDGNKILIENNVSLGDRLNGIEVYNRANPMTDVIIRNNKVTQDPNSKLENDDDDPARYRGYTAISILTNEKNHKWTKPLDKGRYVISNNTIEGLTKPFENGQLGTFGILFRNNESSNDYSLNIEGNTITGDSTDYIISVNNNTAQASRGVEGGGSGDITISRNKIEVDDIKQLPIYINDDTTYVASVIDRTTGKRVNKVTKVPFTKTRGSINIDNNELTVSKIKSRWKNAVAIESTNASTIDVNSNTFKYKDNEPWQRYDVTRRSDGAVIKDIMQAFFGINRLNDTVKVTATDNKFIADTPNKNGFFRLYNGEWVNLNAKSNNVFLGRNTLDGKPLAPVDIVGDKTVETLRTTTTTEYIIETRETDELPIGFKETVQKGVPGKKVNVYKITKVGDTIVGRQIESEEVIQEPKREIVLIGTATETFETVTEKETVEYETEIRTDPTKPKTYQFENQAGKNGSVEKTYQIRKLNGKEVGKTLTSETVIDQPVKRIITVGSAVEKVEYTTEVKDVDFETVVEYDYTKPKGYEEVRQEGEKGRIESQYKLTYLNDELVDRTLVNENVLKEKKDKIVVKGLGVVVSIRSVVVVEEKDFNKVIEKDETQPEGYSKITQVGSPGTITTTYEVTYEDDVEVSRKEISKVENPKAVDEITVIGTSKMTERTLDEQVDVPFKTIYVSDNTLPAGESVVDEEGSPGQIIRTFLVSYRNGKEIGRTIVSEHKITDAVNRVVRVGNATPIVETTELVDETESIDYNTFKEFSDQLPAGTTKVIQAGKKGQKTNRYSVTKVNGEETSRTFVESNITTDPVDEIIQVGTRVKEIREASETSPIPFTVKVRKDTTKPIGYRVTEVEGQNGEKSDLYKVTYINGTETKREHLKTTVVREAVDKVIVEGAGVERALFEIQEDKITSTTEYRNDDTLPEGETKITQVGEEGLLRKTIEKRYFNDELRSTKLVESKLIKEATPTIILVGTKHVPTIKVEQDTQTEKIAYKTQNVEDPDLPKGQTKVVQVGRTGIIEKIYQLTYKDGVLIKTDLISSKEVQKVQDEIIHIGTQVTETKEINTTSPIPYNVIIRKDKTKPVGYSLVEVEGQEGTQTDYYQVTYVNGKETKREHLRTDITVQPVNKVLVEGSGIERIMFEIQEERITSPTEFRNDDTLPEGETKIIQEGQDGLIRKTIEKQYFNDEERSSKLIESKTVREAVPTIILVGTKHVPNVKVKQETRTEETNFRTVTVIDENMPKGERKLVQEGRAGLVEKIYQLTYKDGVLVKTDLISVKELRPALEQIIHIGSQVTETKEISTTSAIPYNTIVREDKTKPVTYRLVEVEGQEGSQTDYYQVTYVNGKETQREYLRTVITTQPVNQVVVVGAGVERTVLVTEDEVITHQTEYRNDESLAEGETRVFQEGQDGLIHKTFEKHYFNDEELSSTLVDTKVIRKAVTRVILVGTKRLSTVTTEELIEIEVVAFEKRIVENPNKAEGTVTLLQEGKTGKRQYKYRLTIQDGRVIKKELIQVTLIEEPVHEITELGTKVVKKNEKNDQSQDQPGNKVEELNHVSTNPKAETKVESIINSQKDSGEIQENRLPNTGAEESWILSIMGFILSIITLGFFNRQKNE